MTPNPQSVCKTSNIDLLHKYRNINLNDLKAVGSHPIEAELLRRMEPASLNAPAGTEQAKALFGKLRETAPAEHQRVQPVAGEGQGEQLQKVYDYFMGPHACGNFTCSCNKPDVCGICELRQETEAVLRSATTSAPHRGQLSQQIAEAVLTELGDALGLNLEAYKGRIEAILRPFITPASSLPDPCLKDLSRRPRMGSAVIIRDDQGRVLVGQRCKDPFRGYWVIPGGGIWPNETINTAAIREIKEETGLDIEITGRLGVFEDINETFHIIIAMSFGRVVGGEMKCGDDCGELRWIGQEEFAKMQTTPINKQVFALLAIPATPTESVREGQDSEGVWVIIYAPTERDPEIFMGAGAEIAARKRYEIAKLNWTCHLLCEGPASPSVPLLDVAKETK